MARLDDASHDGSAEPRGVLGVRTRPSAPQSDSHADAPVLADRRRTSSASPALCPCARRAEAGQQGAHRHRGDL